MQTTYSDSCEDCRAHHDIQLEVFLDTHELRKTSARDMTPTCTRLYFEGSCEAGQTAGYNYFRQLDELILHHEARESGIRLTSFPIENGRRYHAYKPGAYP